MSDIKSVIALLCKHLQLTLGSSMKPEYFRLAKYNKANEEVINSFWTILHATSRQIVKEMHLNEDFDRYDDIHATKLHFAFMKYPTIEFYGLSLDKGSSRELLIAFGWLLATKNALNIAVRTKLASSSFGHEFSPIEAPLTEKIDNHQTANPRWRMNEIINTCGRIGHNVKEIAELTNERIKLTTKIHAASLNTSGLPHLSVSEIALAKKSFGAKTGKTADLGKAEEEKIADISAIATILETHDLWTKKERVFYDWMISVIEENRKTEENSSPSINYEELSNFLSLLRHVTKKRMHSLKSEDGKCPRITLFEDSCVSRFLRTQQEETEAEKWTLQTMKRLDAIEIDVDEKMKELTDRLSEMLKAIPNCVEI